MTEFMDVMEEALTDLVSQVDFITSEMSPVEAYDAIAAHGYRLERMVVKQDKEEFICLIEMGMEDEDDEIMLVSYVFTENDEIKFIRSTKEEIYNGIKRSKT